MKQSDKCTQSIFMTDVWLKNTFKGDIWLSDKSQMPKLEIKHLAMY